MAIQLIGHQPIDFTYSLDGCEQLSDQCIHYQTGDKPMFQFRNTIGDTCGFLIFIRNTDGTAAKQITDYTIQGEYITATIDFNSLFLEAGCYEIALYEICSLYGSNVVVNGDFTSDLSGWTVSNQITLTVTGFTYESAIHANDGSVTVAASDGTPPYTYSIDGTTFQSSTTFSGLTQGTYTIIVKDSTGLLGETSFFMDIAVDCSTFSGSSAFSIKDYLANQIKNCEAYAFI